MITATQTKIYTVEISTSLNNWFVWEIEDYTLANVLERITPRLRGLAVVEVKIGEAIE